MSITLRVEDMSCDGCEDIVETALEEVSGVEEASADHEANTAVVEGDADVEDLLDAVDYAGYSAEFQPEDETDDEGDESEE
ncbi:heavy metal transport/detoxification protein [Halodesulfurarchaeum formicicum]|uniref:Heavy metal transport/detoxification protein n=1 Tax=Halodesulfurarchaeum formicicum TaxID=1873524 RepID=A0A1D8S4P7_9EURY|nr:heavy-metal-associated domain-containing protein [Halodesulfurarchaeum formicicum]AOW80338.1 heavy metal transport/detoxification protein [Halodesulfurarchaeum formicicum]APE95641.1 heavy metal transport/detoxification protein [Halodesulfurarchaeum formicicum]